MHDIRALLQGCPFFLSCTQLVLIYKEKPKVFMRKNSDVKKKKEQTEIWLKVIKAIVWIVVVILDNQ